MNKPVAWMYRVNNSFNTFSTIEPPDDAYDESTLVPLYTLDDINKAKVEVLRWLADEHYGECQEDRPIQHWIRAWADAYERIPYEPK